MSGCDPDATAAPMSDSDIEPLTGTLVRYTDGPDQLTIYPPEADDVTLMASWVTADAGDFVELDSIR